MKKILLIILCLYISGCEDDSSNNPPSNDNNKFKYLYELNYKLILISQTELKIRLNVGGYVEGSVYLIDTGKVFIGNFTPQLPNYFYLTANVNYNFPDSSIKLRFFLKHESEDSIHVFDMPPYHHKYINNFQITNLYSTSYYITQFDLSPDKTRLFYKEEKLDGVSPIELKVYNLITNENTLIKSGFQGGAIRALNNTTLVTNTSYPDNNGNYPTGDSNSLCLYNTNNQQFTFLTFMSRDYGRMSRIVRNHIIVNKPYFDQGPNSCAIDLTSNTIKSFTINWVYLNCFSLDNIWIGNYYYDEVSHSFVGLPLSASSDFGIYQYDNNSQYLVGSYYLTSSVDWKQDLQIYQNNQMFFSQRDTTNKTIGLVRDNYLNKNKIIFFQRFLNTDGSKDGYYEIDFTNFTQKLIMNEENGGTYDYWINNNEFISIRGNSIVKFSLTP